MTADQLRNLGAVLSRLEEPGFDFGHWVHSTQLEDGALTMPYFELSADGLSVVRTLPVQMGFDWPRWAQTPEARSLFEDHSRIADATAEQLIKLTTSLVRSDRFTEGSLAGAFESGLLLAIARRASVLSTPEESKRAG